jgi:hypothetical protein
MNKQLWTIVAGVLGLGLGGAAHAQLSAPPTSAWQLASGSALGLQLPASLGTTENGNSATTVGVFSSASLYQQIATLGVAQKSIQPLTTVQITRTYFGVNPGDTVLRFGVQVGEMASPARPLRFNASSVPSYSLLANVSRPFATPLGTFAVGGTAAYGVAKPWGVGERSRAVFQGGVDAALKFSASSQIGLAYSVESGLEPGSSLQRNLSATYGYQFTPGLKMLVSVSRDVSRGFFEPAIGLSGGVLLRYSY